MRLLLSLLFVFFVLKSAIADYQYAYCSLVPVSGASSTFTGYVQIYKKDVDNIFTFKFNVNGTNIEDGSYGVTINKYGAGDLGGVYNPNNNVQGCPAIDSEFRVGDLDDIVINQGGYLGSNVYAKPQLSGDNSIIGRSLSFYDASICNILRKVSAEPTPNVVSNCVIGYANTDKPENLPEGLTGVNTASASLTESANGLVVLSTTNKTTTQITGQVSFRNIEEGVEILSGITGLTKEAHGFHIHSYGQFSQDGSALGGHWLNSTQTHSLPFANNSSMRHYGDLGNICTFDAAFEHAYYKFVTNYFNINNVFGHGFAVHATRDLGDSNVGGARILQGVVAMVDPTTGTPSNVSPSTSDFKFDNICPNGAVDGETNSSSDSQDSSSSKLISSLFILGLFSSLFVLLL